MWYLTILSLAIGFGLTFSAIASAISQSKAIVAAMNGISRQPESAGQIQTSMIIGLAFIEALTIYSLVLGFVLMGKLPGSAEIMQFLMSSGAH